MDSLGGGLCQQQAEVLTCTESENFQYNQWMTFSSSNSYGNLRSESRVPVQSTQYAPPLSRGCLGALL